MRGGISVVRAGITGDTPEPGMRREPEPSAVWDCLAAAIPRAVPPGLGWQSRAGTAQGWECSPHLGPPGPELVPPGTPTLPHELPEPCKLFMPLALHQSFFHTVGRLELLIHYLQSSLSWENSGEKFTEMY